MDEDVPVLLGHVVYTVAKKHYIKNRRIARKDPKIPKRREMLEAVEERWLKALKKHSPCDRV